MPPWTWTQGSILSSQRDEIPCIWGGVFVVVARLRAAPVPRLSCGRPFVLGDPCPFKTPTLSSGSLMASPFSRCNNGLVFHHMQRLRRSLPDAGCRGAQPQGAAQQACGGCGPGLPQLGLLIPGACLMPAEDAGHPFLQPYDVALK